MITIHVDHDPDNDGIDIYGVFDRYCKINELTHDNWFGPSHSEFANHLWAELGLLTQGITEDKIEPAPEPEKAEEDDGWDF